MHLILVSCHQELTGIIAALVPRWLGHWKPPGEVSHNTFCVGRWKPKCLIKAVDFQGHTNLFTFLPYHLPSLPPAKCSLSSLSLQMGGICPWALSVSSQLIINHHNIPYVKRLNCPRSMENSFISWVRKVLVLCHPLLVKRLFCEPHARWTVLAGAINVWTGKPEEKVKLVSWILQQNWCCTIGYVWNCNATAV